MAKFINYLSKDCIFLDLEADTKEEIIKKLADELFKLKKISYIPELIDSVLCRESIESTALANNVAIPQAITSDVEDIVIALGTSKEGVYFNSLDLEKSKIFILILYPLNTSDVQARILTKISKSMKIQENRDKILEATNNEEVFKFLEEIS